MTTKEKTTKQWT